MAYLPNMQSLQRKSKRSTAGTAMVELRCALNKSQQEFAVEFLHSSIGTVARYETTMPPVGQALINLAKIAKENGQPALSETFKNLYLESVLAPLETL